MRASRTYLKNDSKRWLLGGGIIRVISPFLPSFSVSPTFLFEQEKCTPLYFSLQQYDWEAAPGPCVRFRGAAHSVSLPAGRGRGFGWDRCCAGSTQGQCTCWFAFEGQEAPQSETTVVRWWVSALEPGQVTEHPTVTVTPRLALEHLLGPGEGRPPPPAGGQVRSSCLWAGSPTRCLSRPGAALPRWMWGWHCKGP